VSISIVREVTERTPPPRALFVRFPFGHALGEPGNREQQLTVLLLAFRFLYEARSPGEIRDAELRWRRETYASPSWSEFAGLGPVAPTAAP